MSSATEFESKESPQVIIPEDINTTTMEQIHKELYPEEEELYIDEELCRINSYDEIIRNYNENHRKIIEDKNSSEVLESARFLDWTMEVLPIRDIVNEIQKDTSAINLDEFKNVLKKRGSSPKDFVKYEDRILSRLFYVLPTFAKPLTSVQFLYITWQLYSRSQTYSNTPTEESAKQIHKYHQFFYIYTSPEYYVHPIDLIHLMDSYLLVLMFYMHPFYFERLMQKLKNTPECKCVISNCPINLSIITGRFVGNAFYVNKSDLKTNGYLEENMSIYFKYIEFYYGMSEKIRDRIIDLMNYEMNLIKSQKESEIIQYIWDTNKTFINRIYDESNHL